MPRQPKLRKKRVGDSEYWFTAAGGSPVYFGNVADVSYKDARQQFTEHVQSLSDGTRTSNELTTAELVEHFLDWISKNRSDRTYDQRRRDCNRFGTFKVSGRMIFRTLATAVTGDHLERWLRACAAKGDAPQTLKHRQTSIRHCWNWGSSHPSPRPYLPVTFRPFSGVEPVYTPPKVLTEDDLIRDDEIETILAAAEVDLDQFHRFGPKQSRESNPYQSFADLLRCYYHTGARTGELAAVEVGAVLTKTKQVLLGQHKTSKTQRVHRSRIITLNDEAMEIFDRHCTGKKKRDRVFTSSDGKPVKPRTLASRFARVKEIARELDIGDVRETVTIYSFRHLWISEMLMSGVDIAVAARMAGTSIAMIERTYGHFRNEHLQQAQATLDAARSKRRPD